MYERQKKCISIYTKERETERNGVGEKGKRSMHRYLQISESKIDVQKDRKTEAERVREKGKKQRFIEKKESVNKRESGRERKRDRGKKKEMHRGKQFKLLGKEIKNKKTIKKLRK